MGKYSLLITLGVVGAVSILSLQGEKTSQDTAQRDARRSGQVLARQVARTGYNAVLSEARLEKQSTAKVGEIVSNVDTIRGKYEGGAYEAWLEKISPTAYKGVSVGRFPVMDRVVKYRIGAGYEKNVVADPPELKKPSKLKLNYQQSGRTGYCSAVYMQRTKPDVPADEQPTPEVLYPPSDEERSPRVYNKKIEAGTKLNFILAVYEKEYNDPNCGGREGDTDVPLDGDYYDQTYRSFEQNSEAGLEGLQETSRSIIEDMETDNQQKWRVAFEGYEAFNDDQLWDIKQNGYPSDEDCADGWACNELSEIWEQEGTYGGDGWEDDMENGLYDLDPEGSDDRPDFNDEVFTVTSRDPQSV